jgi:hypothetical protein
MIESSGNPVFITAVLLGSLGFTIAVFWISYSLEKDHKKKPHKHKKA